MLQEDAPRLPFRNSGPALTGCGNQYTSQDDNPADEGRDSRYLPNRRDQGSEERCPYRLAENGQVDDKGREELQSPVHPGMTQQSGKYREPDEDRYLTGRLRPERNSPRQGDCQQREKGSAVHDRDIAPDSELHTEPPSDRVVEAGGKGGRKREEISEKWSVPSRGYSSSQVRHRDEYRAKDGNTDSGALAEGRSFADQQRGYRRHDCWLETDQSDRCGDGGQVDRRIPRPEMEGERDPADHGEGKLASGDAPKFPPLPGETDGHQDDAQREAETPDGDRNRIGSRELDERPGE